MTKKPVHSPPAAKPPLIVRGERVAKPDWDRYVAALVAFALRRVEETAATKEQSRE